MYRRQRSECGVLCGTICRGSAAEGCGLIECENLPQNIVGPSGDPVHCTMAASTHPFEHVDGLEHEIFPAGVRSLPGGSQCKLQLRVQCMHSPRFLEHGVIDFPLNPVWPRTTKFLRYYLEPHDCPETLKEWLRARHAHRTPSPNEPV